MPSTPSDPVLGRRPVGLAVLAGLAVGLATSAIVLSMIAIPLFALARADPVHGLDRPLIRTGLLHVALPAGVVVGALAGLGVALWYRRGGRLPLD